MKCDSCINQIVELPTQDSPYDEFFCSKYHWGGGSDPVTKNKDKDPWKFCKDYKPKL